MKNVVVVALAAAGSLLVTSAGFAQGSCTQIGHMTTCSDGSSSTRIGNHTFYNDGSSSTRLGNHTFHSQGVQHHQGYPQQQQQQNGFGQPFQPLNGMR